MPDPSAALCQQGRHLLRWLCSLGAREPSPKAGEQMASITLYPPDERRKRVRGEPTRRPVNNRRTSA